MNRHLIARKDAESWRKSRRRKDANFLSKRRARLRPLAFGLAVLMATTSPLTAFANGTGTTSVGTPSSTLYSTAAPPALNTVGQGGCAQQYTTAIDNLTDQANTDNTDGLYAQDVGLVAQGAGLIAEIAGLSTELGGDTAETIADGAETATLATEDVVANPSPAGPEAAVTASSAVITGGKAADLAGAIADGAGLATSLAGTVSSQLAQGKTNNAQALTDYTQGNSQYSGLNQCGQEFTGTITEDANINAGQGISADNGAIWLGDTNGTTYSQGITLGGGALSGAGTGGLEAFTGDPTSIAIGNGASADSGSNGSDDTALGTNAKADDSNSTAVGANSTASTGGTALGEASTASNERRRDRSRRPGNGHELQHRSRHAVHVDR